MSAAPNRPFSRCLAVAVAMTLTVLAANVAMAQKPAERPSHPSLLQLPAQDFKLPDAESLRFVLSNGIPVYFVPDATVPLVEIAIVVDVGGSTDPQGQEGLAALTGSMLRRAGAGELSADEFDEEVDYLGARIDTFGGTNRSGLSLSTSPQQLEPALKLAYSALAEPRFEESRLTTARANLEKGLAQRNDDPVAVADREWRFLIRPDHHPDNRSLTGTSLDAIDRDSLVGFHRRHYQPSQMIVAVSGAVSEQRLRPLLEATVGTLVAHPAKPSQPKLTQREVTDGSVAGKHRGAVYHYEMDTPQAMVWLGHLLAEDAGLDASEWTDRTRFTAILLSEILGGSGPVSRLRSALRAERSLVYRVGAGLAIGQDHAGLFEASLATEPELVAVAVAEVRQQVNRLRRERVSQVELSLAKRSLLSSFPLLFDSAESVAGRYAEDELLGRPHAYWQAYLEVLPTIEAAELQRLARKVLDPERFSVLVVGPSAALPLSELEGAGFGSVTSLPSRDPIELAPVEPVAVGAHQAGE